MAEKITYFALVDELSSQDRPGGVVRRIRHSAGQRDEAFSSDLKWKPTSVLYASERGDTQNEFVEISAEEAERIVERIRAEASGAGTA